MICPTKKEGSGTSSAAGAERSAGKLTGDPRQKTLFVRRASGPKDWLRKHHYLTTSEKKQLSDFAKAAKEHFEKHVKPKK